MKQLKKNVLNVNKITVDKMIFKGTTGLYFSLFIKAARSNRIIFTFNFIII